MLVQTLGGEAGTRTARPKATFLQSVGHLWLAVGLTVTLQAFGVPPFWALMCSGPVWLAWVYVTIPVSVMVCNLTYLAVDLFFRDVVSRNTFKVPSKAPVIFVCAPHSNQLIDPLIVMRTCPRPADVVDLGPRGRSSTRTCTRSSTSRPTPRSSSSS